MEGRGCYAVTSTLLPKCGGLLTGCGKACNNCRTPCASMSIDFLSTEIPTASPSFICATCPLKIATLLISITPSFCTSFTKSKCRSSRRPPPRDGSSENRIDARMHPIPLTNTDQQTAGPRSGAFYRRRFSAHSRRYCGDAGISIDSPLQYAPCSGQRACRTASVVEWIQQPPPKGQVQVRFLSGAPKYPVRLLYRYRNTL